jgi:ABC-2 type transport system permease protein
MARYKGMIALTLFIPVLLALFPILIGTAAAGSAAQAAINFEAITATKDYKFYLLLGTTTLIIVMILLWDLTLWLRTQMQTGILEAIYLTPTKRFFILIGKSLSTVTFALMSFGASLLMGCAIFGINPLRGNVWLAITFIIIGIPGLIGISFLFAATVLKIKEARSIVGFAQWAIAFFMGALFPITVLPAALKYIAYTLPPTWIANGVRAAMLNTDYFYDLHFDLMMITLLSILLLCIGSALFRYTELNLKRNEGVGLY